MQLFRATVILTATFVSFAPTLRAQFEMPDPKQMSGIPRPVDDLPNTSISVRVIRGSLSNNLPNRTVELHVGSKVLKAQTDEAGRAEFDGLTPGENAKATTDVDGEHLESQEFPVPAQGGVRLLLVATDTTKVQGGPSTLPNAPAISGEVSISGRSRVVLEPGDESVELYYMLDIVNSARAPVNTPKPFTFDMPPGAASCQMLEGTAPTASVNGTKVEVKQPFLPGTTPIRVACHLSVNSDSLVLNQRFPAALEQIGVIVKYVGDLKLASPQITRQQDMPVQGEMFVAGIGSSLTAGQPLSLTISGLPHHSPVPRLIALTLAGGVILIGVLVSWPHEDDAVARTAERQRLVTRRERLLTDLARLERDRRNKPGDDRRYATRREELVSALEHVYGALDSEEHDAPGPEPAGRAA